MSLSDFDESRQILFRQSIATVSSVPITDVNIANIQSIVSGTSRRRMLSAGIRIDIRINAATHSGASQLSAQLSDVNAVNTQLLQVGLPVATMLELPVTTQTNTMVPIGSDSDSKSSSGSGTNHSIPNPYILGGAVAGAALFVLLIVIITGMGPQYDEIQPLYVNEHLHMIPVVMPHAMHPGYYPIPDHSRNMGDLYTKRDIEIARVKWHKSV